MSKTAAVIGGTMIFSSSLTNCASIVSGTSQVISVETKYKNEAVSGVNRRLENGKGIFFVTTSGTVMIHEAYADLLVTCEKANLPEGLARVESSTKAMAFDNIILNAKPRAQQLALKQSSPNYELFSVSGRRSVAEPKAERISGCAAKLPCRVIPNAINLWHV